MARIAVVTDSTSDIPDELVNELDIRVLPLDLRAGERLFSDTGDLDRQLFDQFIDETGEVPAAIEPTPDRFAELYRDLGHDHDGIISIHLSSRLSGTVQSAEAGREQLGGLPPVVVIDSRSTSMGLGFPVLRAAAMARTGADLARIERVTREAIDLTSMMLLLDTLEPMRRSGRVGWGAEVVGTILHLKPILRIEEGVVVPFRRTRSHWRALAELVDLVRDFPRIDRLAVISNDGQPYVEEFMSALGGRVPAERVIFSRFSAALSSIFGPGALGVAVYEGEATGLTSFAGD
ncbi:MAG TPA: DegV family protein [Thermomicrobiaceae bacterium]|nr:DegV family protein [Thermomicrobiaceae bacterium]